MSDLVGRTLSKVQILKLLGRGGMAEVYLGRHTTLNRQVAVKLLHAHLSDDESLLGRFKVEAQAVAQMRHPNIVQVFDFDVVDDRPYIVMELLEGLSLKDYISSLRRAEKSLPFETTARLITALAAALDYAHARGIVHRDIKPANVMLRCESGPIEPATLLPDDTEPVLTDFGVARIANAIVRTASGEIMGTPAYMSPEQIRGETVDSRSDIYSLGIMLYEMLSGRLPFDAETQASILIQHVTEPPPPLEGVSLEIQHVVDTALAKSPDRRYQTAGELATALRQAVATSSTITDAVRAVSGPVSDVSEVRTARRLGTPSDDQTVPLSAETIQTEAAPVRNLNPIWFAAGFGLVALVVAVLALAIASGVGGKAEPAATDEVSASVATESVDIVQPPSAEGIATESTLSGEQATVEPVPVVDTTTPRGVVTFRDAALSALLTGLDAPPDGSAYEAWLSGPDIAPLSLGVLQVTDGQAVLEFTATDGQALLTTYSAFVISVEPTDDSDAAMSAQVVYRGEVSSDILQHVRALYTYTLRRRDPFSVALLEGLKSQAQQYDSHLGLAVHGIQGGSLAAGKQHAEHTVNIALGASSPDYGDLDGNGRAENPGDDVGLGPYLFLLQDAARSAVLVPNADVEVQQVATAVIDTTESLLQTVGDAARLGLRITSSDTLEEAQPLAAELNTLVVQSAVVPLVQQAEGLDLAITVQVFAVAP